MEAVNRFHIPTLLWPFFKEISSFLQAGRGCYAQKSQIRPISRHPKFRVTDQPTNQHPNQGTHPLIESLSQGLKTLKILDQ